MTHLSDVPTALLPDMIGQHTEAYERLLGKENANREDLIYQAHHETQARLLTEELRRRQRECSACRVGEGA